MIPPKIALSLIGSLCLLGGTFVLSRNLLYVGLKKEVAEKIIISDQSINKIYQMIATKMFGFSSDRHDLLKLFANDRRANKIEMDSAFEPIRGLVWIGLGTLSQILSLFF